MTNDLLEITGLRVKTHIGVYRFEQSILQTLLLDIRIQTSLKGCNDCLDNTIDYATLCHELTTWLESSSYQLIETVAEQVLQRLEDKLPTAGLTVRVSKPHAIKNAGNISVTRVK